MNIMSLKADRRIESASDYTSTYTGDQGSKVLETRCQTLYRGAR